MLILFLTLWRLARIDTKFNWSKFNNQLIGSTTSPLVPLLLHFFIFGMRAFWLLYHMFVPSLYLLPCHIKMTLLTMNPIALWFISLISLCLNTLQAQISFLTFLPTIITMLLLELHPTMIANCTYQNSVNIIARL